MENIEGSCDNSWNYCKYPTPIRCDSCKKVIPYELQLTKEMFSQGQDYEVNYCVDCFLRGFNLFTLRTLFKGVKEKMCLNNIR